MMSHTPKLIGMARAYNQVNGATHFSLDKLDNTEINK